MKKEVVKVVNDPDVVGFASVTQETPPDPNPKGSEVLKAQIVAEHILQTQAMKDMLKAVAHYGFSGITVTLKLEHGSITTTK
jgi:hypothetical protein